MRRFLQGHTSAGLLIVAILLAAPLTAMPAPASAKDSATQEFLAQLAGSPSVQACIRDYGIYTTYYSNATLTQEVGWCDSDCYCNLYCEGQQTQYWKRQFYKWCF
jgi:hypothetical protein